MLEDSFPNQETTKYDRYTNLSAWPKIASNNKEREKETGRKPIDSSSNVHNLIKTKENREIINYQENYRNLSRDTERERQEEKRRRQERIEREEVARQKQERRKREREKQGKEGDKNISL